MYYFYWAPRLLLLKVFFLFALLNQLLETYKTDPKVENMMKNLDFYVTPVLNVDGYMYSWQDNTVSAFMDIYQINYFSRAQLTNHR